jgi:hypothetical protein
VFKERDERWSSMFGQRLPMQNLVGFPFNFIPRHGRVNPPQVQISLPDSGS